MRVLRQDEAYYYDEFQKNQSFLGVRRKILCFYRYYANKARTVRQIFLIDTHIIKTINTRIMA